MKTKAPRRIGKKWVMFSPVWWCGGVWRVLGGLGIEPHLTQTQDRGARGLNWHWTKREEEELGLWLLNRGAQKPQLVQEEIQKVEWVSQEKRWRNPLEPACRHH